MNRIEIGTPSRLNFSRSLFSRNFLKFGCTRRGSLQKKAKTGHAALICVMYLIFSSLPVFVETCVCESASSRNLLSTLVLTAFGVLLDRFVFRLLQDEDPIITVLVTFGLLLIIEDVARTIWGKDLLRLQVPELLAGVTPISGTSFPIYRLAIIGVAIAVGLGLSLWLRYSRVGLFVRASSVDPVTTGMQGVNTEKLGMVVVGIGAGLAGLGGTVAAPLLALSPNMGASILIDCFIVVVTGGLSSFSGAFIAAMLIGQLHNFGVVFVPTVASLIPLLLMVAVLLWRPQGLAK